MATYVVLLVALIAFSCAAEAVEKYPKALAYNAAPCPTFPKGGCTKKACASTAAGYLAKFRSVDMRHSETGKPMTISAPDGQAKSSYTATYHDCCNACAESAGCSYWQWIPYAKKPCYLLNSNAAKSCSKPTATYGTSDSQKNRQIVIGGRCNPDAAVKDDPHFTGAQGTHFDFSGLPDKSFCLLSDTRIHINILLRGYLDNRTESVTAMSKGMGIRTWIREVGFIWTVNGTEHKVHMVARSGVQQTRGTGFLTSIAADGETVPVPALGQTVTGPGGFSLSLDSLELTGPFDTDVFSLKIAGLLDMSVRMRVANPLLQSQTDAEAHFNLGINDVLKTDAIHGVLGQTYRKDHAARAEKYSELAALLKAPVVADAASGKGFLDGEPLKDYITSDVLTPDCNFAAYSMKTNVAAATL